MLETDDYLIDTLFRMVGLDTEPHERIAKLHKGVYGLNKWECGAVLLNKEEVNESYNQLKTLEDKVWKLYYTLVNIKSNITKFESTMKELGLE